MSAPTTSRAQRQQQVREAILQGTRGVESPFPLLDDHGELVGPFRLMAQFPEWGGPLQALGSALRFQSLLTTRAREIVILTVARHTRSPFEVYAHTAVARTAGFSGAEIKALLDGRFRSADPMERSCLRLAAVLVEDGDSRAEAGSLGDAEASHVVLLVGYYRLLAQLMHHFAVGLPADAPGAP